MNHLLFCLISLLAIAAWAIPVQEIVSRVPQDLPRLVIYFQTTHNATTGQPISMLPLITEKGIALTHLIVCSFHINEDSVIHLNDFPPSDPHFDTLWAETKVLQNSSVKVMGMIGGAAPGSFNTDTLDGDETTFDMYYSQLRDVISTYNLQGMDLDVEQSMSQAGITRLINQLHHDFGPEFLVTLAPVASALSEGGNLSGFDYKALDSEVGNEIAFYNGQFYNGFGSMATTASYDAVIANGFSPQKVLAGQVTSPTEGSGFTPFGTLNATIIKLRSEYGQIGGVMGWEYFDSQPGGTAEPWEWAQAMTAILRPHGRVNLTITNETAQDLQEAWERSVQKNGINAAVVPGSQSVDYMSMVNT